MDTWASTAAGAFALAENNLYTVDAFRDYLAPPDRRRAGGFHAMDIRSAARILAAGVAGHRGAEPVGRATSHGGTSSWGAGGQGGTDTVLISRKPFYRCRLGARPRGPVWRPRWRRLRAWRRGHGRGIRFAELLRSPNPLDYERNYPFDISPVTDNRPFFFYTVQPRDMWCFCRPRRASRRLQSQPGCAAAVRADGVSMVATR